MTSKSPVGDISVVTLIRTDTTLDHSQKAEDVSSTGTQRRYLSISKESARLAPSHRWLRWSRMRWVVVEGRVCGRPLQERPRHRAKCGAVGGDGMTTNIKRSFGLLLGRARTLFGVLLEEPPSEELCCACEAGKRTCSRNTLRTIDAV